MVGDAVAPFNDLFRVLLLGVGDGVDIDSLDPCIVEWPSSLADDETESESGGVMA